MRFSCADCGWTASVADDRIRGKIARLKCRRCGAAIALDGRHVDAPRWHVATGAEAPWEATREELLRALRDGTLARDVPVWTEALVEWTPAREVAELAADLPPPAVPSGQDGRRVEEPVARDDLFASEPAPVATSTKPRENSGMFSLSTLQAGSVVEPPPVSAPPETLPSRDDGRPRVGTPAPTSFVGAPAPVPIDAEVASPPSTRAPETPAWSERSSAAVPVLLGLATSLLIGAAALVVVRVLGWSP